MLTNGSDGTCLFLLKTKSKFIEMKIPTGNTKEDVKERKNIILRFYQEWKSKNQLQKRYNLNLQDYINIRNISMVETSAHASKSYLSTLAVLQLDAVLTNAKKIKEARAKNNGNQKGFEKIIIMECLLPGIGNVKLTVGVKKSNKEKVQYCITFIETK